MKEVEELMYIVGQVELWKTKREKKVSLILHHLDFWIQYSTISETKSCCLLKWSIPT